ncbi:MAG: hypothetical protein ACTHU0_02825 [Kofleriaceae bacterium]
MTTTTDSLEHQITRPPRPCLGAGVRRQPYPTDRIRLREEAVNHVRARGFCADPAPLDTLHHRVRREDQCPPPGEPVSPVSAYGLDVGESFMAEYYELVKFLAREVLELDVVFERNPTLRFHFPVPMPDRFRAPDGAMLTHHSDTLLGDPFPTINCWLPLSACRGTSALLLGDLPSSIELLARFVAEEGLDASTYVTSRVRFFEKLYRDDAFRERVTAACAPAETNHGEVLMFDPRTLHGTAENVEDLTRVSVDFRLVPLADFEAWERARIEAGGAIPGAPDELLDSLGTRLMRGEYFDARTAFEL